MPEGRTNILRKRVPYEEDNPLGIEATNAQQVDKRKKQY